jgi:hypothetical protein
VDCLAVRERLTEYAVSTLPPPERREVEHHLQWCAGCRKEAAELGSAARLVGLSLPQAEPPADLEDRVVVVVRNAASRAAPAPKRSGALRAVTLFAAVIGLLGLGTAGALFAQQQTTQGRLLNTQSLAHKYLDRLNSLLSDFNGQAAEPHTITRAVLASPAGASGGGGAMRITSHGFEDMAVVLVGALPQHGAPYRVWLRTPSGRRLFMGRMLVDTGGGGTIAREYAEDLSLFRYVEVLDADGRVVLQGGFA